MKRLQQPKQETFTAIIECALSNRSDANRSLHPHHKVPGYVVSMCEELVGVLHACGNDSATLNDIIRLEGTCTGADYQAKLALRCQRLAMATQA